MKDKICIQVMVINNSKIPLGFKTRQKLSKLINHKTTMRLSSKFSKHYFRPFLAKISNKAPPHWTKTSSQTLLRRVSGNILPCMWRNKKKWKLRHRENTWILKITRKAHTTYSNRVIVMMKNSKNSKYFLKWWTTEVKSRVIWWWQRYVICHTG
jgi:hypothetical protein